MLFVNRFLSMKFSSIITTLILLLTTIVVYNMELYKYDVMTGCETNNVTYPIFPWVKNPILSKSPIFILKMHLIASIFLTIVFTINIVCKKLFDINFKHIVTVAHYFFIFSVLINCHNLINFNKYIAIIVNITLVVILQNTLNKHDLIYYTTLISPVFFELLNSLIDF